MRGPPEIQQHIWLVKSREKFAEELGGGGKDYFVGRDHHWAAGRVITHEADIGECLIISKLVEESLDIGFKVVVGKTKQRTHHHERTAFLERGSTPLAESWRFRDITSTIQTQILSDIRKINPKEPLGFK